ncbi:MAG: Uma2 family endonuclease [Candidatus Baltobacteraceae bacterium]
MSEMAIDYQRRPITVEEYERMAELGIIGPEERVELLDGELILMPPMTPPHFASLGRLTRLFVMRLGERAVVVPQAPIRIASISEPEPDFMILAARDDFYLGERASPATAQAFVECSVSSLAYDRGKKLKAYARAGIPEYWIVNLVDGVLEVHRDPHDLGYAFTRPLVHGARIALAAFPDIEFEVSDILGPLTPDT